MNKSELAKAILADESCGIKTKAASDRIVQSIISAIVSGLKSDRVVSLAGFGTFRVKTRKARMGRNPKTGESIMIPERNAVSFKAGTGLKKSV